MSVGRFIKRFLPRGLFGRSLLIVIAPVALLLIILTYVFFERELDITTRSLARDVAADISLLVALEDSTPALERDALRRLTAQQLRYRISFQDGAKVQVPAVSSGMTTIDRALGTVLAQQIGPGRHFVTGRAGDDFEIKVDTRDGMLDVIVPRARVTVLNPDVFFALMVGAAVLVIAVAAAFQRNQVRPIEKLARAAESFGKGRAVPDFKPYGATEVRRAAQAFITMRERIERHVTQRTEMLAGVSHDLKTPLTRMKLALAMMPPNPELDALQSDIDEMEHMLDDYLAFARGEGGEESSITDLAGLVRDTASGVARAKPGGPARLAVTAPDETWLTVKPAALKRCLTNVIDNAFKHGRQVAVSLTCDPRWATITVEDDGPGIPEARREEAFRPFHRLDEGRNLQKGGSGLGLAIARDIARAHGGDITLAQSAMGGVKAVIRLPV
jgi:two-component system osmolarity sensor histidine kinase EnvZ